MMIKTTDLRPIVFFLALSLLAGCSLLHSENKQASTPSPAETAHPTAGDVPSETSAVGESATATASAPSVTPTSEGQVKLVLWTTEDYAPTSETPGGQRLLEQLQAFRRDHDVGLEVILKKRSGIGGLLDFLTTASAAAPSVLPDLITLSDADLYRATQAGLIQPLDGLVSPELLADQFDFVTALTQLDGTTMGVLYQAEVYHLVYDTLLVPEPPRSWRDVYSSTVPFVFSTAAPGEGVNPVILMQYLALGGGLTDANGRPSLDRERLAEALTFFSEARQAGVIPRTVLNLTDASTAWATFRIGEAGMVQVPASIYLAGRTGLSNASFTSTPLRTPGSFTVGRGWALSIVTQDPARQELAAALIEHLLSTENSGAWTQAAGRLPTRVAAFDAWSPDDPYVPFIRNLLAQANPATSPDLAAVVGGPLTEALIEVLRGRASPEEAAEAAALAVEGGQ